MDEPLLHSEEQERDENNSASEPGIHRASAQSFFPELASSLCSRDDSSSSSTSEDEGDESRMAAALIGGRDELQSAANVSSEDDHLVINVNRLTKPALGLPRRKVAKKCRTAPALMSMHRLIRQGQGASGAEFSVPSSIVTQATIGLTVYLLVGMIMYLWKREEFSGNSTFAIIDGLYFCIVTMCTIGYGDITPVTPSAKMFSCFFVLVGFGFIDFLLSSMVAYALDRQEMLLISTVDTRAKSYLVNTEKGRMRTRTKVAVALGVVLTSVGAGTLVMHHQESLGWLDSFYLACMSVTTVGYGDHAFKSSHGRLFAAIWLLVSTIAVARAVLFLAEAHIDRRQRLIARWVLERKMTLGDLVAADLNNDGFISMSEYVIYKLKEMGKIKEKDVLAICNQFNQMQCGNFGKITLSRILEEANA